MDAKTLEQFVQWMGGALKVMTISPSVDAATGFARFKALLKHGVLPAMVRTRERRSPACRRTVQHSTPPVRALFDARLTRRDGRGMTSLPQKPTSLARSG